jgi:hypothetical protein
MIVGSEAAFSPRRLLMFNQRALARPTLFRPDKSVALNLHWPWPAKSVEERYRDAEETFRSSKLETEIELANYARPSRSIVKAEVE